MSEPDDDPPQWGGVRCQCGEEVLPYLLSNGIVGVHFMDACTSHDTGSLEAEVRELFAGWSRRDNSLDSDGLADIQQFRAVLAECIDRIDYELSGRRVSND